MNKSNYQNRRNKRLKRLCPRTIRPQHIEGDIYLMGKLDRKSVRNLVIMLDEQVGSIQKQTEGFVDVRKHFIVIDATAREVRVQFISPEEVYLREEMNGDDRETALTTLMNQS